MKDSNREPKINRVSNILICDDCLDRFGRHDCRVSQCIFFMVISKGFVKKAHSNLRRYIVAADGKIQCIGADSEIFGG